VGRLSDFPTDRRYLGPPRVAQICFDLVRRYVDDLVQVTDDERQEALRTLWGELEISAGPFGATAATAALWGRVAVPTTGSLCAIVGSSGEDGLF
jgi:threonine dehydratase